MIDWETTVLKHIDGACFACDRREFHDAECLQFCVENHIVYRYVDCTRCPTIDDLYSAFAKTLGFPEYFGYNWDAYSECMRDHEFKPRADTLLIIDNFERALSKEPFRQASVFVRILNRVAIGFKDSNYFLLTPPEPFPPLWVFCLFDDVKFIQKFSGLTSNWTVLNAD